MGGPEATGKGFGRAWVGSEAAGDSDLGPTWAQLEQVGGNLGPAWAQLEPTWSQLGSMLGPDRLK